MVVDRILGLMAVVPLSTVVDRLLGLESENDNVPWLQDNRQEV